MIKDTYYFSHDSNARNDIKLIKVRRALGMEGYGIYFCLIEILREQNDFKLPISAVSDLAFDMHVSEEKVTAIIKSFDLFCLEDDKFFSSRLLRSMSELTEKRQRFIEAGKKGGEASVKQRLSIASSNAQPLNKSKVNKSKVINIDVYRSFKHLTLNNKEKKQLEEAGYAISQIDRILDEIENYKNNKNYTSLYLTAKKWLSKEVPENTPTKQKDAQSDFFESLS